MLIKRTLPLELKDLNEELGEFTAYGSVFGVVDSYGDVIERGAYKKTLKAWKAKKRLPAMLWQHQSDMPVGVYTDMQEDEYGLRITGKLALETNAGRDAWTLLKMGAISGFSIGFALPPSSWYVQDDLRHIKEIDLWEVSIVTFPACEQAQLTQIKEGIAVSEENMKDLVFALQKSVENFHSTQQQIFESMKARSDEGRADLHEKLDKNNTEIENLRTQLKSITEERELEAQRGSVNGSGEKSIEHKAFYDFVRNGGNPESLKTMVAASGADGGYLVPEQLVPVLVELMQKMSPMRGLAEVVTVSSSDVRVPIDAGGEVAEIVGESDERSDTASGAIQSVDLGATICTLAARIPFSNQLLQDSAFPIEPLVNRKIARSFAIAEDALFVTGSGSARPKGIAAYATAATADDTRAFGTIQHVFSGAAGDFVALNVGTKANPVNCFIDAIAALKAQYLMNANWLMRAATLATLRKTMDTTGRSLVLENYAVSPYPTIQGRPVVEDENMPAMAANALAIALADFKLAYWIVDRIGITTIRDPYTKPGFVRLYAEKRVGGACVDTTAIKFIKLAVS